MSDAPTTEALPDLVRRLERELEEATKNLALSRDIVRNQREFIAQLNEEAEKITAERDKWKTKAILHGNAALELEEDLKCAAKMRDIHAARVAELEAVVKQSLTTDRTPDADGWIPHKPGDPMPCDPDTLIFVKQRSGSEWNAPSTAGFWDHPDFEESNWNEVGEFSIIAWKPA